MSSEINFENDTCIAKITQQTLDEIKNAINSEVGIKLDSSIFNITLMSNTVKMQKEAPGNDESALEYVKEKVNEVAEEYQIKAVDDKKVKYSLIYPEKDREIVEAKFVVESGGRKIEKSRIIYKTIYKNGEVSIQAELKKNERKIIVRMPDGMDEFHFKKIALELLFDIKFSEKIQLDKFQFNAASYLAYSFENPIIVNDDTNIAMIKEFLPHLIGKEYKLKDDSDDTIINVGQDQILNKYEKYIQDKFNKNVMEIPLLQALFMIEIFATNQPNDEKFNFKKIFLKQKYIYKLAILPVLPVAFEYANNNAKVSFADTDLLSASEIQHQFQFALGLFKNLKIEAAQFINVDIFNFDIGSVKTISEKLKYSLIKSEDIGTEKAAGFAIWCLPNEVGIDPFKKFEESCREEFKKIQTFYCLKCEKFLSANYSGECFISEHTGNQIPFDDGQKEHVEYSLEGDNYEQIVLVRFSCCGVIPKSQMNEGCFKMVFPCHKFTDESPSRLQFVYC